MTPDLSLVICTLNEAEAIGAVLRELDDHLTGVAAEIIVVDDSSDEATADAVRAFTPAHMTVRLLRRQDARGLASAAVEGWAIARGRLLGLMDGDGQHDPAVIARLIHALELDGADIAVASRYVPGAHTGLKGHRQALSVSGTVLAKQVTGVGTSDPMSGLFVFRRDWFEAARGRMNPVGYKVLLDLALSGGRAPKIVETPTALRQRLGGESKLDVRVLADLAAQLVEKSTGGLLSARFVLFGAVGASGVIVNVGVLSALTALGETYWLAGMVSILAAMTSNFLLNNLLTFRDRRLSGHALFGGLMTFYLACAGGALINQVAGLALHRVGAPAAVAGLTGAMLSAVWNYASASRMAWGGKPAHDTTSLGAQSPLAPTSQADH